MPEKVGLLGTKAWLQSQLENRGSFVRYSLSTMADSDKITKREESFGPT